MKRVRVCNDSRVHVYLLGHTIYSFLVLAFFCDKYRAVGILSSVFGEKIACRIGAEQNCSVPRSSRVNNNGMVKKRNEALHERQQPAAGAFSAFGDARNASGGILTGILGSHYEQEHNNGPLLGAVSLSNALASRDRFRDLSCYFYFKLCMYLF